MKQADKKAKQTYTTVNRSATPVDAAAPPEIFHGTDILNGVGNKPKEENNQ
ncbi:hypothetical protein AB6A23_00965 [Paenibacillus tarimensis]